MKTVMPGEIYEVLPDTNSIIFTQFGGVSEDDNNKMWLVYNMFTFENNIITKVNGDVYKYLKFGANCEKITKRCGKYAECHALLLNEGKVFTVDVDGSAILFDGDGEVMWTGQLKYKNKAPNAVAVCGDGLWGVFSDFDCLVRFNATTMREELRLGKKGDIFNCPRGVFAEGNSLYVASRGGKRVIRVDLRDYSVTELYRFKEPVYSYVRARDREFVVTKSGLYEL